MKTFIARQPIFDNEKEVVGYELLFRGADNNATRVQDDYQATLKVVKDAIINFGVHKLTNDKRAFIKFNKQLLMDNIGAFFKPEKLVLELSGDIVEDDSFLEKIHEMKVKGYLFAIDKVHLHTYSETVLKLMDIIKVDFSSGDKNNIQQHIMQLKPYKKIILAEKVENQQMLELAKGLGCSYYQGYFFQVPVLMESTETSAFSSVYFEMLKELNKEEINYQYLAELIKKDTKMTLSILKLINSAAYYANRKVTSVKDALVRMGENESRRILLIHMLKAIATDDSSKELIQMSLKRGRVAEKLAPYYQLKERKDELFLVGLLSLINIILRQPMKQVLMDVPLKEDVIQALIGEQNVLSQLMEVIILDEAGAYKQVATILERKGCSVDTYREIALEAVLWADVLMD